MGSANDTSLIMLEKQTRKKSLKSESSTSSMHLRILASSACIRLENHKSRLGNLGISASPEKDSALEIKLFVSPLSLSIRSGVVFTFAMSLASGLISTPMALLFKYGWTSDSTRTVPVPAKLSITYSSCPA